MSFPKSLQQILREETLMKEQFSDDPNAFTTEITDVTFSGLESYFPEYKGHDMDISYLNCSVKWRFDLDLRSWGIKDMSVYTTSVMINAWVEIYDEEYTKVEVEKEIELVVDDMGGFSNQESDTWYYEDMQEEEINLRNSILPVELEIDLADKSVSVIWN
jgi:hypothetical protein|tara:strand:- start:411 stop:890 length:480 start_codon:yes stop_codon:yes gene_type:complete